MAGRFAPPHRLVATYLTVATVARRPLGASAMTGPALSTVRLAGLRATRLARLAAHLGATAKGEPAGSLAVLALARTLACFASFAAAHLDVRRFLRTAASRLSCGPVHLLLDDPRTVARRLVVVGAEAPATSCHIASSLPAISHVYRIRSVVRIAPRMSLGLA